MKCVKWHAFITNLNKLLHLSGNDGKGLDKAFSYVQPKILSEVHSALAELRHDDHSEEATSSQASDVNQSHTASTESTEIGKKTNNFQPQFLSFYFKIFW